MRFEESIDINAPAERVWQAMIDVERWPEWTPSIIEGKWVRGRGVAFGNRARIRQPSLPPATWRVTEYDPGRYFAWEAGMPGFKTIAGHRVEPSPSGCRVSLSIEQSGILSPFFARMWKDLTERYLGLEAEGLKEFAESRE